MFMHINEKRVNWKFKYPYEFDDDSEDRTKHGSHCRRSRTYNCVLRYAPAGERSENTCAQTTFRKIHTGTGARPSARKCGDTWGHPTAEIHVHILHTCMDEHLSLEKGSLVSIQPLSFYYYCTSYHLIHYIFFLYYLSTYYWRALTI